MSYDIITSGNKKSIFVPTTEQLDDMLTVPFEEGEEAWQAAVEIDARGTFFEEGVHDSHVIVHPRGKLDMVTLHTSATEAVEKTVTLHDGAHVRMFTTLFADVELSVEARLEGNNCSFEHYVLYLGREKQDISMNLIARHIGKNTSSNTEVRGMATDNAHASFAGSITIGQTGAGTDGHLAHEGLLMSRKARIDALPGLEIGTDDVKAQHSSAIHYIRDEQLFYLQSRGIDADTGRHMIVSGFLEEILDNIHNEEARTRITASLSEVLVSI